MRHLHITLALATVLVVGCSAASTPTPGDLQAAPTSLASSVTPIPNKVQVAPTPSASSVTPTPGQSGVEATSAAAASPPTSSGEGEALTVTSAAFAEGASIPKKYSCDGSSVSPALKWSGAPTQTASFALIVDDPDAPVGTFTHWVAFDIPSAQTEIPEGAKTVGKAGRNSAGRNGYTGPCPPSGTHRYIFTVYALDVSSLNLNEGASRDQVSNAMKGHVVAEGMLMGRYSR